MARPECRRCGSDLVVAALTGNPSEWVEELRSAENAPARVVAGGTVQWLCRSCGLRWDPEADARSSSDERSDPLPDDSHPGAVIRRAREERALTLAEAARATRIAEHHLRALETDASLDEFPTPYARFFLREYAELLQLQPEPLLEEFDARHPAVEAPALQPLPDRRDRRGVLGGAMVVMAVVSLVVIALLQPRFAPQEVAPLEPSGTAVLVHDSGRVLPALAPERRGLRVVLRMSQPCWVQVLADGEVVASTLLGPGEPVVYRARRDLQLTLGNAGGVKLRVNDEPVPTGDPGDVVVLNLSWERGEVSIARG